MWRCKTQQERPMPNEEQNIELTPKTKVKKPFIQTNMPLAIAAAVLVFGSGLFGYSVGHRQGLTVVGFEADAEQLVEVVQKQKTNLEQLNRNVNQMIQERDVAVSNANDLYAVINQAHNDKAQAENMSVLYREILRQRGGVSLAVQHLAVKPLPENAFEYQLDLVQVSPSKSRTSGSVEIRLIQGTEVLVVPMEDKNFNFDNHERLTGRWTLPKGFSPQFIEVRLTGSGTPVVRRFSWSKGEAIENQSAFISEIPQAEANAQ